MQWIKATDRMPGDWIKAITRHWQTKHKAHYSHVKNGNPVFNVIAPENIISYVGLDSIEWLDETEWQPMDIAPKDTAILICDEHQDIYIGRWLYDDWRESSLRNDVITTPIGWQPLPKPMKV